MAGLCSACGLKAVDSRIIRLCADCLRKNPAGFLEEILKRHEQLRKATGLVPVPPRGRTGKRCGFCVNDCLIPEGGTGYCGVRKNEKGRIRGGTRAASLGYYYDPLPTNCVADWVCPAGSDSGFPEFSPCPGPEQGYLNLAVFYHSCTFHCLNCQNWHFRGKNLEETMSFEELAGKAKEKVSCICYFGGDPTPYLVHSLLAGKRARRDRAGKVLRICWETNGGMNQRFLKPMLNLALSSGGIIKFDLKAMSEPIHLALTGSSNHQTLSNFAWLANEAKKHKRDYPVLVASTLLIPGLIDEKEIFSLAGFIAGLDPKIPYPLLAFHPDCHLSDLPMTSREQAESCREQAKRAGLRNIRLGNIHLLA